MKIKIRAKLLAGFLSVSLLTALLGHWLLLKLDQIADPLFNDVTASIAEAHHASEIDKLAYRIKYLDEVQTQSVRIYAHTHNKSWEQRYYAFKPLLDYAIQQAVEKSCHKNKNGRLPSEAG